MWKKVLLILVAIVIALFVFFENYKAPIPDNHGKLQTTLYLGDGSKQPLIVAFGGGEGGNAWTSDRWSKTRQQFLDEGYAFLAIGYFGMKNTSASLDRISLNAVYDTIIQHASNNPQIDTSKIALLGASKGAELILNLASRYNEVDAVVAMVPSHVSFPAITIMANTSSWHYNNEEVPFVPAPWSTVGPALKGDLYTAHQLMLEDEDAVRKAAIPVEKINGPIFLLSAQNDEQWPSSYMSKQLIKRLDSASFGHYYEHIALKGGHAAPLQHFDKVLTFLNEHFR